MISEDGLVKVLDFGLAKLTEHESIRIGYLAVPLAAVVAGSGWWLTKRPPAVAPQTSPQIVRLTSYPGIEGHPTFSPDADQVAFHSNGENQDNFDIYVKVVGTAGPPLRLTQHPARDWAPEWSPDGKSIAFIRNPGLSGAVYVIPRLGGPERKVCDTKGDSLSWSP